MRARMPGLAVAKESPVDLEHVLYEKADDAPLVTITVNRPDKLNALNHAVVADIHAAFVHAKTDPDCAVVILTGAGPKAFVAGADIAELAVMDVLGAKKIARAGQAALAAIENLGKPVIAMINGYAFGGGLETALACHLRTMAEGTQIGLPEVGLGIFPGFGGTQRLPRVVGRGRALEMILTGDPVDAETALRYGLVNRVAPADELRAVTEKLARRILMRGRIAVGIALESVLRGTETSIEEGLRIEADMFGLVASTQDMREGLNAFLEKRKPNFQGE
jgi:enoyl-CoA hydratase